MSGVAIEELLGLWSAELRKGKDRLRLLFAQTSTAESAAQFLDGLLGPEQRKTGWMHAEAAGDMGPWRQQAVLGRAQWDADVVREYALETLTEPDAVFSSRRDRFPEAG
jgi:SRSO17 transposase